MSYFFAHIHRDFRKPLIIMAPKNLLRHICHFVKDKPLEYKVKLNAGVLNL